MSPITNLTSEYESMIARSPIIVQVSDFFDCSIFSESAPPITILRAAIAIMMIAIGAAKYKSVPAMICRMMIVPAAAPLIPLPLASISPAMLNGSLIGLRYSGIVSASAETEEISSESSMAAMM